MYGRILHHCLMKSWNSLLSIGYTSYKLVSLWMSFSQCNCHLQVYHDVISQILSPHWATILFISTSYSHIQLYISWGQLDLYTLYSIYLVANFQCILYTNSPPTRYQLLVTNNFDDLLGLPLVFLAFSTIASSIDAIAQSHPNLNALSHTKHLPWFKPYLTLYNLMCIV